MQNGHPRRPAALWLTIAGVGLSMLKSLSGAHDRNMVADVSADLRRERAANGKLEHRESWNSHFSDVRMVMQGSRKPRYGGGYVG
jgi:hypothetical protein